MNDDYLAQLRAYMSTFDDKKAQHVMTALRQSNKSMLMRQMQNYPAALKHDDLIDSVFYGISKPWPYPSYAAPQLIQLMHDHGLHDKAAFGRKSVGDQQRFLTQAMKRARSDHPHNKRWKPLLAVVIAAQVARALETS